jgi:hypothetical protein
MSIHGLALGDRPRHITTSSIRLRDVIVEALNQDDRSSAANRVASRETNGRPSSVGP